MRSYSLDLRERVLAAVARGMPRAEVLVTFTISSGSLKRWLTKQRRGADLRPGTPPGPQPTITAAQHPELHAQLTTHPDATLAQHAALWNAAHGTTLSQWTLGRAIRSLGWTRKKRHWQPPSATTHSATPSRHRSRRGQRPISSSSTRPAATST